MSTIEKVDHIVSGTVQLSIAFVAILEITGIIPEHTSLNTLLIMLLGSIGGAHHLTESTNGKGSAGQ